MAFKLPFLSARPSTVAICIYAVTLLALSATFLSQLYLEGRQTQMASRFDLLRKYTPVSCEPDIINHGRVVHIDCPVTHLKTMYPPSDFSRSVDSVKGLFFETKVEMYQWSCANGRIGLVCGTKWSESKEFGGNGWFRNRENPEYWPAVAGQGRFFPSTFYGGGFQMDPALISTFKGTRQLDVIDDGVYEPAPVRPPQKINSRNTKAYGKYLYTGSALDPVVGDMRVSFHTSNASHVSAIGLQECRFGKCSLVPMRNIIEEYQGLDSDTRRYDHLHEYLRTIVNTSVDTMRKVAIRIAPLLSRKHIIANVDEASIIVREGDHSGYKLLYDAVSGGKSVGGRRWFVRFLTYLIGTLVACWSYGIWHPQRRLNPDIHSGIQVVWIFVGSSAAGLFCSLIPIALAWLFSDFWMGIGVTIMSLTSLGICVYIGEMILIPVAWNSGSGTKYTQLVEDPIHSAMPPEDYKGTILFDERSESSFYSPL